MLDAIEINQTFDNTATWSVQWPSLNYSLWLGLFEKMTCLNCDWVDAEILQMNDLIDIILGLNIASGPHEWLCSNS